MIYIARRSFVIPVLVSVIRIDEVTRVVAVSGTADLSLLLSLLQEGGVVTVTGYSQACMDGRKTQRLQEALYSRCLRFIFLTLNYYKKQQF